MLQSDPDIRFSSEDVLDHYWAIGTECDGNNINDIHCDEDNDNADNGDFS